jgi:hypothetical protein
MIIDEEMNAGTDRSLGESLAVFLARVLVPGWLLVGAILKLMDGSPSNLPVSLVKLCGGLGIDLMFVLQLTIAVELAVVGVMWLLPQLALPTGIAMLGTFLPVLVADVMMGASSCGCFGAVKVHPAVTLIVDLGFLVGLAFFGRRAPSLKITNVLPTKRVVAVGLWTVLSFVVGFGLTSNGTAVKTGVSVDRSTELPSEGYYIPQYQSWLGQAWSDVPISAWVRGDQADMTAGTGYVLFYRKDCEHCHELMEVYFSGDLLWPTTAVAVPERDGFPTEGLQPFACDGCSLAELPTGVDWFMATPVLVRLHEGVVECAAEVTAVNPVCIDW